MKAIVQAIAAGALNAEARLVVANNSQSPALEFARAHRLAWRHISAATIPRGNGHQTIWRRRECRRRAGCRAARLPRRWPDSRCWNQADHPVYPIVTALRNGER